MVVALDVEPSRQRLTTFDIVVLGATYSLGSIHLTSRERLPVSFSVQGTSCRKIAETEEYHSGTFPRAHRSRYSLQDSDGDSLDYPALLYNNG